MKKLISRVWFLRTIGEKFYPWFWEVYWKYTNYPPSTLLVFIRNLTPCKYKISDVACIAVSVFWV